MKLNQQDQAAATAVVKYVLRKIELSGSQAEAARMLRMSDAQLINVRTGSWEKVSRKSFNRLVGEAGLSSWSTHITQGYARIAGVADEAQTAARMIALVGFTGAGKTFALRQFAEANSNAYYLLTTAIMSRMAFAEALARACGVRESDMGVTPRTVLEAVVRKLNSVDQPLIILDDFGKVTDDIVRMTQLIYDSTEGNCGILLSGTPTLEVKIQKKIARGTEGFDEFSRRIAWWQSMPAISRADVKDICMLNGVTDESAHAYLFAECKDLGTLKNQVQNAITLAENKSPKDKGAFPITRELLAHMNEGRRFHSHKGAK